MLYPEIPILEKIVRSAAIYLFLLATFKFSGRRQLSQWTPFRHGRAATTGDRLIGRSSDRNF